MSLLQARIIADQQAKQCRTGTNPPQLGRRRGPIRHIRTYNFPQGRMTDHRINLTLYQLEQIMDGDLHEVIDALRRERKWI